MQASTQVSGGVLSVETPEAVAFELELAGVGSRGLALAVDTLAVLLIIAGELAVVLVAMRVFGEFLGTFIWWIVAALLAAAFVTYWGYFIFGEVYRGGRTWGKRVTGLRVMKDDGAQVGFVDSAIRNLVRLVDILPGSYAVGIVSMLLSPRAKRLGDYAAGTLVVRDPGDLDARVMLDPGSPTVRLAAEYVERADGLRPRARSQAAGAVLRALGEAPEAVEGLSLAEMERRIRGHVAAAEGVAGAGG